MYRAYYVGGNKHHDGSLMAVIVVPEDTGYIIQEDIQKALEGVVKAYNIPAQFMESMHIENVLEVMPKELFDKNEVE